jgi:hypothetical protein
MRRRALLWLARFKARLTQTVGKIRRRRWTYAGVVATVTFIPAIFVLWTFPHQWPYSGIVGVIALVVIASSAVLFGPGPTLAMMVAVTAAVIGLITVYKSIPARAAQPIKIYGKATCANHAPVMGVYIRVFHDPVESSFADWQATRKPYVARYWYTILHSAKFKIGVGCGGTRKNWGDSLSSRYEPPGHRNFVCYTGKSSSHPERGCFLVG